MLLISLPLQKVANLLLSSLKRTTNCGN